VGDRYFGEDYRLFWLMEQKGVAFVVRLRDEAVVQVETELSPSEAERQNEVIRTAWVRLGCTPQYRSLRVRAVWVQTPREVLLLVTNLAPAELGAGDVALLYKERWRIELFFRWVKMPFGLPALVRALLPGRDPPTLPGAHRGFAAAALHRATAEPADDGAHSVLSAGHDAARRS
jgi:hypothetical protein